MDREQLRVESERARAEKEGWGLAHDRNDLAELLKPRTKFSSEQLQPTEQQQQRYGRRVMSPSASEEPSPTDRRPLGRSNTRRRSLGLLFGVGVARKPADAADGTPGPSPTGRRARRRGSVLDRAATMIGVGRAPMAVKAKSAPSVMGDGWESDFTSEREGSEVDLDSQRADSQRT
jgi:hypothetical protein